LALRSPIHVRVGSLADIAGMQCNVRYYPKSRPNGLENARSASDPERTMLRSDSPFEANLSAQSILTILVSSGCRLTFPSLCPEKQLVECRAEFLASGREAVFDLWRHHRMHDTPDDAVALQVA